MDGFFVVVVAIFVVIIVGSIIISKSWDRWINSRIEARGVRTVGRVLRTTTITESDTIISINGSSTSTFHYLHYEFDGEGRVLGPFNKKVSGKVANKKAGDEITVHYLPENPLKHTIK